MSNPPLYGKSKTSPMVIFHNSNRRTSGQIVLSEESEICSAILPNWIHGKNL